MEGFAKDVCKRLPLGEAALRLFDFISELLFSLFYFLFHFYCLILIATSEYYFGVSLVFIDIIDPFVQRGYDRIFAIELFAEQ